MLEVQYSWKQGLVFFPVWRTALYINFLWMGAEWDTPGLSTECTSSWWIWRLISGAGHVPRLPSTLTLGGCGASSTVYGAEIPSIGGFLILKSEEMEQSILRQAVLQVFVYRILSERLFLWQCKGLCRVDVIMIRNRVKKKFTSKYLLRDKPWFLQL